MRIAKIEVSKGTKSCGDQEDLETRFYVKIRPMQQEGSRNILKCAE
jgi:hypothetical protein